MNSFSTKCKYFLFLVFLLVSCNQQTKKMAIQDKLVLINRIAQLKPKFNYVKDSFTNIYWYQPKIDTSNLTSILKSKIYMDVKEDGSYNLLSMYLGDRFIYHNQVKFKINDSIYSTGIKDSLQSVLLKRQITSKLVLERLVFTEKDDNNIPKKIYESQGPIMVIFCGSQSDFGHLNLSENEIQKIKDGYEISQLLKNVRDTTSE